MPLLADGREDKDFPEGEGSQDSMADGERTIKVMFCLEACFMSVKEKLKKNIVQPQREMASILGKKLKSGPFYIILEVFSQLESLPKASQTNDFA